MRYVRLKRGDIISYDENADDVDKPSIIFYPSEVVKESDNVEELFDEMICDERLVARYCNLKETIKRLLSEGKTVYGAIWTKGKHKEPILKSIAELKVEGGWLLL